MKHKKKIHNPYQLGDQVQVINQSCWQEGLIGQVVGIGFGQHIRIQVLFDRYEAICTLADYSNHHDEEKAAALFAYSDPDISTGIIRSFSINELVKANV